MERNIFPEPPGPRPAGSGWRDIYDQCLPQPTVGPVKLWPAFWQHDPASEASKQKWIDSTLRFYETTGTTLIKLTGPAHYQVADRGVEGSWQGAPLGERTFTRRPVHSIDDWKRLPLGITSSEEQVVRVAAILRGKLPPTVPLLVTVFAPATQAMMLSEPSRLFTQMQEHPEAMHAALERLALQTIGLIHLFSAAHVDGIFFVSKHHDTTLINDELYRSVVAASDKSVMEACKLFPANIIHLHGLPVHLSGLPTDGRWIVHIEDETGNPSRSQIRKACRLPVFFTINHDLLNSGDMAKTIDTGLHDIAQRGALVGVPCAVPLRYSLEQIAAWSHHIRKYNGKLSTR